MRAPAKRKSLFRSVIFAALLGVAVSLALTILFALALQKAWLDTGALPGFTIAIKVISAAAAACFAVRGYGQRAWLTGALAGLVYAGLAFLIFSILSETFVFTWGILSDLGIGLLSGMFTALLLRVVR